MRKKRAVEMKQKGFFIIFKGLSIKQICLESESLILTTDCKVNHQAMLLEKSTYSLALFTNLKQKLLFCKYFVNGVRRNYWDIVLFAH